MSVEIPPEEIEIIQEFVQESHDMIDQLEPTIIELGKTCQDGDVDNETINAIFRLFHSMKGSAGFLEFNQISQVAHAAENLLDLIRSGKITMVPEHVNLLCQSCDFAKDALGFVESNYNDHGMEEQAEAMKAKLAAAIAAASAAPQADATDQDTVELAAAMVEAARDAVGKSMQDDEGVPLEEGGSEAGEEFQFSREMIEAFAAEGDELLQSIEEGLLKWGGGPGDMEFIAGLFREVHSFKGNCGFFNFADLERLSHLVETVLDAAKKGVDLSRLNATDLLLGLVDVLKGAVADIGQGGEGRIAGLEKHIDSLRTLLTKAGVAPESYDAEPRLGDLLLAKGVVDREAVGEALEQQKKPVGKILVEMGKVTEAQVEEAAAEQKRMQQEKTKAPAAAKKKPASAQRQDIRVDLEKLDNLINLIGEMVIAENMVVHNPDLESLELENFNKAAQHMGKIVRDLQEMAMILRMVPVSGLFRRMIRLVHDISVKSGKKADLLLYGEETEIDKTVIETITDPLVHLLRNSMDHGLEPPEERRATGKPEKGVITLSARHEEGEVWITVEDDGRGLNREKLLRKAAEKGLIDGDGADMTDRDVFKLIFAPGFSTADKVTDISGRGVGMDVVRQNLEKIKGKIEVSSKAGLGTRVLLRIPLTLAIIAGMLCRVGRTKLIVPLLAIREIFQPDPESITVTPEGDELVKVRGKFFPVVRLHGVVNTHPAPEMKLAEGIIVLVEHQETGIALFLDEILGEQQTVIKGLSDYFGAVRCISGCTILGNGEVCLILDVGSLAEMRSEEEGD